MKNKEIQEQRMRGYFIQAAKELIRSEGLKSVSVRYVADQAGYSYATLYNYFKDIKDLVAECILEFQEECRQFVSDNRGSADSGTAGIIATAKAYMKYFVQYPGIFELFYLESVHGFAHKKSSLQAVTDLLPDISSEDWDYLEKNKIMSPDEIEFGKGQLGYVVAGLLLFYLNRQQPPSYPEFLAECDIQLNRLFRDS